MRFARLICAQAELQPFEADARAATLNNVLDLGKFHLTVHWITYHIDLVLTQCIRTFAAQMHGFK
jgi:hypothetical protein